LAKELAPELGLQNFAQKKKFGKRVSTRAWIAKLCPKEEWQTC
jgi:hypothetical protein